MPSLAELRKQIRLREGRRELPAPQKEETALAGRGQEVVPEGLWDSLEPGEISEWITFAGGGGGDLALSVAAPQLPAGNRWLIVDPVQETHPTTLQRRGLDLSRALFLQSTSPAEALWVVEQGLRSRAVEIVWCRLAKLTPVAFRRLKLAAETGRSRCLLMRPPEAAREGSCADRRLRISPLPSPCWNRRRFQVEVLKIRNGLPGSRFQVELDYESGALRMVSELAGSARHS